MSERSNVCIVATMKDRNIGHAIWSVTHDPLPHEPKSDHRFRLDLVYQPGALGNYAECKHCGCIFYAEE